MIYVHRKTVYESIGLESIILGTKKGFLPINSIITDLGFDFSQVWQVFLYCNRTTNESFWYLRICFFVLFEGMLG